MTDISSAETAIQASDQFVHVITLLSIVIGLSLTQLLSGLARFVQHPVKQKWYLPHLAWTVFMILAVLHLWWAEFRLAQIIRWSFAHYFLLFSYASLLFFLSTILFPDRMEEYHSYKDYFISRRSWLYGLITCITIVDLGDTLFKGVEYFLSLGVGYPIRSLAFIVFSTVAIYVSCHVYHVIFSAAAVISEIALIFYRYAML